MLSVVDRTSSKPGTDARRSMRRAWWSLLLLPVSFAAAMVVGEGVAMLGGSDQPTLDNTPLWLILFSLVVATAVFASPLLLVARLSREAARAGVRQARSPLVLGIAAVGLVVLVFVVGDLLKPLI